MWRCRGSWPAFNATTRSRTACRASLRDTWPFVSSVPHLPMLSARENATWQDRLDQLQHECGCRAAVAGLAAFVLAGIAWVLFAALQPNRGEAPDYSAIGMYSAAFVAGLILCTLLGKLAGLALAHVRYRRTCRALLQALQKPGSEYSFPPCTPSVSTLTCVTSRPLADKRLQSSRG